MAEPCLTFDSVLFLCVANSARSQMAEGLGRFVFGRDVRVASAGSRPTEVNPYAVRVMAEIGVDLSDHTSKFVSSINLASIDLVVTLCAEEECPVLHGKAQRLSWSMPDPDEKHEDLSDAARLEQFRIARNTILQRLRALAAGRTPG